MTARLTLRRVRLVTVDAAAPDTSLPLVAGPADVYAIAKPVLPTDREGFAVIHLSARHRTISVEMVSVGSLNSSIVHPREVFKGAILANAAAVILVHNHPSGEVEASEEDHTITRRLVQAGELIGIAVLDHVIVAGGKYHSMRERNEI